ncbi:hypothetical protein RINTHM_15130 [Richelia intracellularis HM01]|nr:hypothetical protein RINTHM_15130 [Richelia intracellularis HM01]
MCPHSTIPQSLRSVSEGETSFAVVPVEIQLRGVLISLLIPYGN